MDENSDHYRNSQEFNSTNNNQILLKEEKILSVINTKISNSNLMLLKILIFTTIKKLNELYNINFDKS